jgi:hypothetical protein
MNRKNILWLIVLALLAATPTQSGGVTKKRCVRVRKATRLARLQPDGTPARLLAASAASPEDHKCDPWQEWDPDRERCADKPGTTHHHGHYEPGSNEQCWDECLCEEGTSPGAQSCSPCSFQGTVCIPD